MNKTEQRAFTHLLRSKPLVHGLTLSTKLVSYTLLFKKLLQHTRVYFLDEKALSGAYDYPQDANNKASLQKFIDLIRRMEKDCEADDSAVAAKFDLLKSWINPPILKGDRAYSAFLLE